MWKGCLSTFPLKQASFGVVLAYCAMRVLNWPCYKILVTIFYYFSLHKMKILMILLSPAFWVSQVIDEIELEFNQDISPILSDACFHCNFFQMPCK